MTDCQHCEICGDAGGCTCSIGAEGEQVIMTTDDTGLPDNVIPLRPHQEEYDGLVCRCGSAWFIPDAVCLTREATVTGYALPLRCKECGADADLSHVPFG